MSDVERKRIIDMDAEDLRSLIRAVVREEIGADVPRTKRFVTVREAADYFSVCPQTVRNWVKKGAPARQIGGGEFRIELEALAEWRVGEVVELKAVGG
jgi:excisionase family DNA binding protein